MCVGFLDGSVGNEAACNSRDTGDIENAGSIPGWVRSPGGGNGQLTSSILV